MLSLPNSQLCQPCFLSVLNTQMTSPFGYDSTFASNWSTIQSRYLILSFRSNSCWRACELVAQTFPPFDSFHPIHLVKMQLQIEQHGPRIPCLTYRHTRKWYLRQRDLVRDSNAPTALRFLHFERLNPSWSLKVARSSTSVQHHMRLWSLLYQVRRHLPGAKMVSR